MMMVSNIENKYKRLRLQNKLSISEASLKLDISKGTLYNVEQGIRQPGIKLKVKMCEVYKTNLTELED